MKLVSRQTIDIILIVLILGLIISVGILVYKFDKEGFECLANPINYYEELENVTCECRDKSEWDYVNLSNVGW